MTGLRDTGTGLRTTQRLATPHARLTKRYFEALADALTALRAFGHEADAKEIEDRYGLVYIDAKPDVRLSMDVPPDERQIEDARRG